jgi:CheY-like chemotaxis protein
MATQTGQEQTYDILLVEDNPGDVELTKDTIGESKYAAEVAVVDDGEPAMAYLRQEGEYAEARRPDLILLDLNLPMKDGLEVLRDMGEDSDLRSIPVMILTGTEAEESFLDSYGIPVSRFSRKPMELSRFEQVVSRLDDPIMRRPIAPQEPQRDEAAAKKKWWWPF